MHKSGLFFVAFIAGLLNVLISIPSRAALPEDSNYAVILAYHRIGEDSYPDTSLRTDQFLSHIKAITDEHYNVAALPDIINALKTSKKLPPKTLAITFEGAYRSTLETAIPLLLSKNIPFTIFYAAEQVESRSDEYLSWKELKNLKRKKGVTLGLLPASYIHITGEPESEAVRLINKARQRHREEFSEEATLFSYPFGEISSSVKNLIRQKGFDAALGLHAGALHENSDFFSIPRFSMTENYGSVERFKSIAQALPLPAKDIEPEDPHITELTPLIGLSVSENAHIPLDKLSCFVSGQAAPDLEILGTRVEIRPAEPLSEKRTRINCTLPEGTDEENRAWRWFGMLLHRTEQKARPPTQGMPSPQQLRE